MLPRCVPRTHLTNAVTISTSTMQVAAITVPFIFAPVYLSWGIAPTLLVTTVIAGASVVSPLLIRASGAPEQGSAGGVKWRTIVEGFHFVRTHPILPGLYLLDIGVTIVSFYRMLFPFFSHEFYGMGAPGYGDADLCERVGRRLREHGGVYHGALASQGNYRVGGDADLRVAVVRLGIQSGRSC